MICLNSTNDSNDSAISYSSMSLSSSSPVKSAAIQQLLESPIIKTNSQNTCSVITKGMGSQESDEPQVDDNDIIVPESPEPSPLGSQENDQNLCADMPTEVANSQPTDDQIDSTNSEINTQNNSRNSFRRQSSVCVANMGPFNTSITSSPRALAILKNAIKTGLNSNKLSDNKTANVNNCEEVIKNCSDSVALSGVSCSPPSNKLFRNSPITRGSALLRAAKERIVRQEIERSPKFNYNQVLNESNYDRQLTGILRKHELTSSPTSGEPKAKKKKVLFAEPVVSSKLEFKPSPSPGFCVEPLPYMFPTRPMVDIEVEALTAKQSKILVHQNSEFDKEFDSDSQHSDSPLIFTDESEESEVVIPSCGQPTAPLDSKTTDEEVGSSQASSDDFLVSNPQEKQIPDSSDANSGQEMAIDLISSQSSDDSFMCSQIMPTNSLSLDFNDSQEEPQSSQSTVTPDEEQEDDPIVMVPLRLSQIKDLYNLFGNLIQQYSDS